jgi:hypothetical protein
MQRVLTGLKTTVTFSRNTVLGLNNSYKASLFPFSLYISKVKSKGSPRQAEVALGVPGRLRTQIISTFSTTRAAFTSGEIPCTHFQRLSRHQGTRFCRKEPWKKSPVTPPGIDLGIVRLVAQCLNHYATPGLLYISNVRIYWWLICKINSAKKGKMLNKCSELEQ